MARSRRERRERQQRSMGVGVGVVGAILAVLIVYQVFLRDDGTPAAVAPSPGASSQIAGSTTTTAPLEPSVPNGSFAELSLRDPFEPIGQVTPTNTTPSTVSTTPTTTASPGTISTTPTTSPLQNPGGTTDVALIDVYVDTNGVQTARIKVGGAEYPVTAGGTFATNYKLISFASDRCVNLQYADSPFSLCVGEQVIK
ncbi:MAG: hypothetical protein JJE46_15765 [Acidimicrobiia bacterium]|nr:hypothetical protein [Acidimicrobiia bacterium]